MLRILIPSSRCYGWQVGVRYNTINNIPSAIIVSKAASRDVRTRRYQYLFIRQFPLRVRLSSPLIFAGCRHANQKKTLINCRRYHDDSSRNRPASNPKPRYLLSRSTARTMRRIQTAHRGYSLHVKRVRCEQSKEGTAGPYGPVFGARLA